VSVARRGCPHQPLLHLPLGRRCMLRQNLYKHCSAGRCRGLKGDHTPGCLTTFGVVQPTAAVMLSLAPSLLHLRLTRWFRCYCLQPCPEVWEQQQVDCRRLRWRRAWRRETAPTSMPARPRRGLSFFQCPHEALAPGCGPQTRYGLVSTGLRTMAAISATRANDQDLTRFPRISPPLPLTPMSTE
jgi:hypothetical protein